jgi:succinate dehydrogenase/fumarate reductase cytochrome b subunit
MFDIKKQIISIICALGFVGIVRADSPPYITITPTPTITPLAVTTYGRAFDNLTSSNFSILYFPGNALSPYAWTTMNNLSIPCFLVFLFIYLGMWLSHANLRLASITGLLIAGAFLFSGGIGVAMPVVIQPLAWGALLASITGIVMSMFKNV